MECNRDATASNDCVWHARAPVCTASSIAEVRKSNNQVASPHALEGWDDDRRVPLVTLDDLIEAACEVVPSASVKEMERQVRLRGQQFSTT